MSQSKVLCNWLVVWVISLFDKTSQAPQAKDSTLMERENRIIPYTNLEVGYFIGNSKNELHL